MKLQIHCKRVNQQYPEIYIIFKQKYDNSKENYDDRLFEVSRNSFLGLDEIVKKLWEIIDSSKTDEKEKMKAINLIMQCYKDKFEMIQSEPDLITKKTFSIKIGYIISHSLPVTFRVCI